MSGTGPRQPQGLSRSTEIEPRQRPASVTSQTGRDDASMVIQAFALRIYTSYL
jgi:hypothetical protein